MLAIFASLALPSALQAVTVPYTEDFATNNANWRSNVSATFMTYVASGGPDGSSYVASPYTFTGGAGGNILVQHRANINTSNPALGGSGNNFVGNWIADSAKKVSAYVRHDAPVALEYFFRVATPANFPGFVVGNPNLVQPNTWTLLEWDINPNNPSNVAEGPMSTFSGVFGNVGVVQLGVYAPAGVNQTVTFSLDQVTVTVPEPSTIAVSCLALVGAVVGRRFRA
jgi:hypothetical protein